MSARRFHIETFGCQMNEHDSEKIAGLLAHRGMVWVTDPRQADLYLINTCSVREKAAQKVYSRLGEFKRRKRENPDFTIGVIGCVAQQEGEEMVRKAPFIDLVVGTHLYHTLPDLLDDVAEKRRLSSEHTSVATQFLKDPVPVEMEVGPARGSRFRANITIMEGCNKHCAFCIVPFTRGKERNRSARQILDEVRSVLADGFSEILLLGQTVNSYRNPDQPRYRFAHLIDEMASLKGLRRLRFTSPHPREFDDQAVRVIGAHSTICNQVHVPLQSGSNAVLRRMRRQYTRESFLQLVGKFRNCGREISLSTDMIVGFPGETEGDFEDTLSLVREVRFESMFSFKYSPRPYTEAVGWEDDIPKEEKTRRLMILQRLQREIQLEIHHENYAGRQFEVLVEGLARDGEHLCGRTTSNKVVNFRGSAEPGAYVDVQITRVGPNSFLGEQLLEPAGVER